MSAFTINVRHNFSDENGRKTKVYDETCVYQEMRVSTPADVAWHVQEEPLTCLSHTIVGLPIHLENEESVFWKEGREKQKRLRLESGAPTSKLTAFFHLCQNDERADSLTYVDVPRCYRWDRKDKMWIRRIQNRTNIISRLYTVKPKFRELFALRLMLQVIQGPKCFKDLRKKPSGEYYNSFQEAARARGLMNDEDEWTKAMEEAVTFSTPIELRRLFANILIYTDIKNPEGLWEKFEQHLLDRRGNSRQARLERALFHVNSILKMHNTSLEAQRLFREVDFVNGSVGLDDAQGEELTRREARRRSDEMVDKMNDEQYRVFKTLKNAFWDVKEEREGAQRLFFLQGAGGCGKTFIYKALHYYFSAKGYKV